jgi:hypothetical protein
MEYRWYIKIQDNKNKSSNFIIETENEDIMIDKFIDVKKYKIIETYLIDRC